MNRFAASAACDPETDGTCSICGDEGLEGRVIEAGGSRALVRYADGATAEVETDLVDEVRAGDRLVVHLGFAIAKVREAQT